ncbi:unnamed protein product [Enterobius vermicularis]|uniref:BTB domain-containing protein n=1 Tax=Enterobius vermicularis TaxID=51028 RepID=A0A0N4V2E3_ENTVE|nr:unnamed protein product [Enterobius vermicularis]
MDGMLDRWLVIVNLLLDNFRHCCSSWFLNYYDLCTVGHEEKMVLSGSDCSCVLVPDQSELESACSTTTYPDILQKLNDMRAHEEACDVFFIVGREKKRFAAHRLILAASSDVFYRNFFGPLISKDGYSKKTATLIPDVVPEAFEILLQFCYSRSPEIITDLVVHTLYAAEKYNVRRLRSSCLRQLAATKVEDSMTVLEQALEYEEMTIVDRCLKIIDSNCDRIIASKGLRNCSARALKVIIGRDEFSPTSELTLFTEVVEFAKLQCRHQNLITTGSNLRQVLGSILYLIRFSSMSVEDLCEAAKQGVLTNEEVDELRYSITANSGETPHFLIHPRCSLGILQKPTYSFRRATSVVKVDWMNLSTALFFQVDRNIFICCVGIYTHCDESEKIQRDEVSIMFAPYGENTKKLVIANLHQEDNIVFIHLADHLALSGGRKYYFCVNLSDAEGRYFYCNSAYVPPTTVTTCGGISVTLTCDRRNGNEFFPELRFTL